MSAAPYAIEFHADDSVTLTRGTLTAHITGATYEEANDAAHALGAALQVRANLGDLIARVAWLRAVMVDAERAAERAESALNLLARAMEKS